MKALLEDVDTPAEVRWLHECISSNDAIQQVNLIKKIGFSLQKIRIALEDHLTLVIEVLIDIYLQAECRHITKRAVASTLQSMPSGYFDVILQSFNKAITSEIISVNRSCDSRCQRRLVENIMSCLENFNLGAKCVAEMNTQILNFLLITIGSFRKHFENSTCPTDSTKASLDCQMAIRTLIAVLKTPQLNSLQLECPTTEKEGTTLKIIHKQHVDSITEILTNDLYSLDCRCSCGIALSLLLTISKYHRLTTTQKVLYSLISRSDDVDHVLLSDQTRNLLCNLDTVSKLCLFMGLLSVLKTDELIEQILPEKSLFFDVILPHVLSSAKREQESAVTAVTSRVIFLWTKRAKEALEEQPTETTLRERLKGHGDIACQLLEYVWTHLEHFIDCVRHTTRDIFDNVVLLHVLSTDEVASKSPFVLWLTESLLKMSWDRRGKYGLLCCLVHYVGAKTVLQLKPSVPKDLLTAMNDPSLLSQALELMETLFTCHKSETPADSNEWEQLWVDPIIAMSSDKKSSVFHVEHILAKLLKCSPASLSYIVSELVAFEAENSACNLRALLVTAKTARHLGLVKQFPSNSSIGTFLTWDQLLPGDLLKLALCHVDDEIRLDAFALLCDSPKTTEIFQSTDLNLIRAFLPYNMTNQTPAFRQKLLAFVKKFLIRLNDGGLTIKRQLEQTLKFDKDSKEIVPLQETLTLYKDFLSWLCSKIFESLYPGANFPRRGIALNILKLIHEIVGFRSPNDSKTSLKPMLKPHHIQTLLECLKDTYENNKTIALNILFCLSTEQLGFNDATRLSEVFEAALQLASESRPTDGVTAAYLFRLLARHPPTIPVAQFMLLALEEVGSQGSQETSQTSSPNIAIAAGGEISPRFGDLKAAGDGVCSSDIVFATLEVLTFQLMVELEMARGSLLKAAAHGPMYGVLFCIRSLLQDLDFGKLSGDKWRTYFATLIGICLDLGEVTSPIVTSASPEGHLPTVIEPEELADINAEFQKILKLPIPGENTDDLMECYPNPSADLDVKSRAITAQRLLLCGWRATKEVSLTLGDICQRSIEVLHKQIARSKAKGGGGGDEVVIQLDSDLVAIDHILQIGDYFITLLAETKHRGAIEQAYVGFCKVCDGLWRSKVSILHRLPEHWLRELLQLIETGSGTSTLCCTRRSAGLPFMVQALVSSEPQVKGSSCFKQAMQCLLQMVSSTSCTNETKVHAFNILRALYRDTCFGEDVTPFIADGLAAAIVGFRGKTWGVRNSATLLFSSLVTRIFGVQRSKDELSRKNCMTGNVFFQRFPSLYQFFTEELKKATSQVDKNYLTMQPCLYPVLLILARLYPSSIEGTQSSLNLSVFIPYVMKCGTSPSIKTRILAAKSLVPLVPLVAVTSILLELFKGLPDESDKTEQNVLHGQLLQIFYLLTEIPNLSCTPFGKQPLYKSLHSFLLQKTWICTRRNPCTITRACFLDILDATLTMETWNFGGVLHETVLQLIDVELADPCTLRNVPGMEVFQMSIARLAIRLATVQINPRDDGATKRIVQLLCHGAYEVRWTILNFLYTVLSQSPVDHSTVASSTDSREITNILLPEPSIPTREWNFMIQVDSKLAKSVSNSEELTTVLITMATATEEHPDCIVQLYNLLPLFPKTFELPWTCVSTEKCPVTATEILELLLQKGECEPRDDIRSSLLHFTGFLIPKVYNEVMRAKSDAEDNESHENCANPHSVITEWIEAFLLCCSPEQSLRVRLTATKLLISNGHILLIDPANCLGFSCLSVWSSAVLLLQDDDPVIKLLASNLVEICSNQNLLKNAIHPALALDILIGQFVNHFGCYAQSECLTTILDWMLRQDVQESNHILDVGMPLDLQRLNFPHDDDIGLMLDKGLMNIYAENINFTMLLRKHFKHLLRGIFQVKGKQQDGGSCSGGKGKEVRSQMLASLGRQSSKSMFDPLLPQSFTLDIVTLQDMSEKFKDIMVSFKVTTNQVTTWLSEEQRDDLGSRDGTGSHVFLQDVIDMVVEELSSVLKYVKVLTNQTAFVYRSFDKTIVRLYRLVATAYCLCKYDNGQKDALQKILGVMEETFGSVQFQNQLIHSFMTDMRKLCSFHNETI